MKSKLLVTYLCFVAIPLLALAAILRAGSQLPVAAGSIATRAVAAASSVAATPLLVFIQLAVVLAATRLVGAVFIRLRQPRVVGEMVAGILLGPSFFGWVAPGLFAAVFSPASLGVLQSVTNVGLAIFMFLVGVSLDLKHLREQKHAAVLISHVSIAAPFVLAAGLSLYLYPRLAPANVGFTGFALFMGAAMAITAFPVLARILKERKLTHTRIGTVAIACAAVDDVTGWCILAYIVVLIRAGHTALPVWATIAGTLLFTAVMLLVVKPLLARLPVREFTDGGVAGVLLLVLASAICTEWLGIHLLFGAFLAGAMMPREAVLVQSIHQKLETLTVVLLLPVFFALSGLRTSIGSVHGGGMWLDCGLIILVAIAGKFGGSLLASRVAGTPWRAAAAIGILMNTRGLMELVILNIGLDIGVISPPLFSMMIVMALATTVMTSPLLELVYPIRLMREQSAKAL